MVRWDREKRGKSGLVWDSKLYYCRNFGKCGDVESGS